MFYSFNHWSVRMTGRWAIQNTVITATANGSYFEIAYRGDMLVLYFDLKLNEHPMPHLWISVDDSASIEVPLDSVLRIQTPDDGRHTVKVIMKSSVEIHNRWNIPLVGKVSFAGYKAMTAAALADDSRPVIEFVGDSITEGVLIDNILKSELLDQDKRVYQDDSQATYAALTAKFLNLRPIFMGYGAVGITKNGCGAVPKAAEAYLECFSGAPITYRSADYILINHGANDAYGDEKEYLLGYKDLLDIIIGRNPHAHIIALSAFCGAFAQPLGKLIATYNANKNTDIFFIDSTGWIPDQPLHPLREGHRIIALKLTSILNDRYHIISDGGKNDRVPGNTAILEVG